ncbi:hypothetical protein LIER_26790 [Lithospermum erythrorhizon]|uniref:Uncharacterized protein n=1 Tax=Lithospermum erythrorhizon TaxID=34254 RepID=A0AAV3RDB2_LITER
MQRNLLHETYRNVGNEKLSDDILVPSLVALLPGPIVVNGVRRLLVIGRHRAGGGEIAASRHARPPWIRSQYHFYVCKLPDEHLN